MLPDFITSFFVTLVFYIQMFIESIPMQMLMFIAIIIVAVVYVLTRPGSGF